MFIILQLKPLHKTLPIGEYTQVTLKDVLRLGWAKIRRRKTVLFSKKDNRQPRIIENLRGFIPFFYDLETINVDRFDLVIPLSIDAQIYLNSLPPSLLYSKALLPSEDCIALCNDKERFANYLFHNGFQEYIPQFNGQFSYPYLLKKRISAHGSDIIVIRDRSMEEQLKEIINSSEFIKQAYIEGEHEFSSHIIFSGGKIQFMESICFKFKEPIFIKGKQFSPRKRNRVDHKAFLHIFEKILLSLNYEGICCFDYKVLDGKPVIFEINPRYGASMTSCINEAIAVYWNIVKKRIQK